MIIIGEKINGAIPAIAESIQSRNAELIIERVKQQEEAGVDYLDVCAGTSPEEEYDALCWLIDVVQSVAKKPICIDSPDPEMLIKVFPKLQKPGLINSISMEGEKCDLLLPLLAENPEWGVVALCCDQNGVANKTEDKMRIARNLIAKTDQYGIARHRIHIDPLVLALSAVNDSAVNFYETIRQLKKEFADINVTAALSNISFGMPARKVINCNFLAMSMAAGLDSVICDPLNRDVYGTIMAGEALLGKDRCCRKYNKAYRAGKIGTKK